MNKTFDYIAEANVTASNQFHGDKVPLNAFRANLLLTIEHIKRLDQFKKTIFYGRDLPNIEAYGKPFRDCSSLPLLIDAENPQRGELLIHSIIGMVTEAGELLELLNNAIAYGVPFDDVNFIEETGDAFWYIAIGLNQVKATFDDVQRTNIAKLRLRFPDKFNEFDANNRDLFAERQVLEKHSTGGISPAVDTGD